MPTSDQYQSNDTYNLVATIASGQTTSQEIDLAGVDPCGFFMPGAFTGTALKIYAASSPGGTFKAVQKDESGGGDYAITVTANKFVPITNLAIVAGLRFIKLESNSTEAADRSIPIAARPI